MAIPNNIKENLTIPVIGAPLFLVSGPELVIAQCKSGVIGSFPALNARPQQSSALRSMSSSMGQASLFDWPVPR